MDVTLHAQILGSQGLDPIVFMRLLRVVLMTAAAIMMLIEPMACGGKNRGFHQILAGVLAFGAWTAWSQSLARMTLIAKDATNFFATVPPARLFWPELLFTAFVALLAGRLLYDSYLFSRLRKFGFDPTCGRPCQVPLTEKRITTNGGTK